MKHSDRVWAIWLAATVGSFAVLEAVALRSRQVPTLSHALSGWMGLHAPSRWGQVSPVLFLTFWAWLTVHVLRYVSRD